MHIRRVDAGPYRKIRPTESRVGELINPQPNGDSAVWISTEGSPLADGTVVVMDGHRLLSNSAGNGASARVDPWILASPGEKPIFLERRYADRIERSNVVYLEVIGQPPQVD